MPARGAEFHHETIPLATVNRVPAVRDPPGGYCRPRHQRVPVRVDGDPSAVVVVTAAQIAAPEMLARGAEFHYEGVVVVAVNRVPAPRDPPGRIRVPSHQYVAVRVSGDAVGTVQITPAQIAAPVQVRVDDQPARGVVAADDLERIGIAIDQPIPTGHLDLLAVDDLVDIGRIVHDLAPVAAQADVQGAGGIDS